jgi:hypothetical protein
MFGTLQSFVILFGLVAVVFSLALWLWAELVAYPRRDEFKRGGAHIWLDHTSKKLVLSLSGEISDLRIPFGSLSFASEVEKNLETSRQWRKGTSGTVNLNMTPGGMFATGTVTPGTTGEFETVYKDVRTGAASIRWLELKVPDYFHEYWATHAPYTKPYVSAIAGGKDFKLPTRHARALQRWLRFHRDVVFPNEANLRKAWEAKCLALLTQCRRQTEQDKSKAIELYKFTPAQTIVYLRIEQDGRVFVASGVDPALMSLEPTSLKVLGNMLKAPMPDRQTVSFELTAPQVEALQKIQRKGGLVLA